MHGDDTQDLSDAGTDAPGNEAGRSGGGEGLDAAGSIEVGDDVWYFHHYDAKRPMAAKVVFIEADQITYRLIVFTNTGGFFPAFAMKLDTPTGKTGHYFTRKPRKP